MKSESKEDLAGIIHGGRPKPIRKWAIIILAAALAGGGWFYYQSRNAQKTGKPVFVTEPVRRGDLSLGITATGNLKPTNQVTVSSELSGICEAVFVDINDEVTKGQKIAKLDTRKLNQQTEKTRATLSGAEARVNQSKATLKEANANYERAQDLHKLSGGRTPSKAEMDTAAAAADRAQADLENINATVEGAKADLLAIESDLSKAIIVSPVNGVVLTRSLEVGQTVAASFNAPELFVIAEDLRKMKLLVSVAEADIGKVKDGQSASFSVDAWPGRTYQARLKRVSFGSTVVDNIVTYQAELEVANDDLTLRPGMTATATIDVDKRTQVLLVPTTALRFKPQDPNAVAASGGPQQNKSFLQSITPQFPRRRQGGRPGGDGGPEGPGGKKARNEGKVWITSAGGEPEEISVEVGITDGRRTEIITDKLKEGDEIIIRQIVEAKP